MEIGLRRVGGKRECFVSRKKEKLHGEGGKTKVMLGPCSSRSPLLACGSQPGALLMMQRELSWWPGGSWGMGSSGPCSKEQDKRGLESSAQFNPLTGGWRVNGRGCVRSDTWGQVSSTKSSGRGLDSSVRFVHMKVPRAGVVLPDAKHLGTLDRSPHSQSEVLTLGLSLRHLYRQR